jgi:hypothetical protein
MTRIRFVGLADDFDLSARHAAGHPTRKLLDT